MVHSLNSYYKRPLPTVQQLAAALGGRIEGGGRVARLPHVCGGERELTENPGLRTYTNRRGYTALVCHYGHEWPDPENAVRAALGDDYLETTARDRRELAVLGGAEAIVGLLPEFSCGNSGWTAECPVCHSQGSLHVQDLADHDFPYLGLSCECGATYDAIHKALSSICDASAVRWLQRAGYLLKDGLVRHQLRYDGARPDAHWDPANKGRSVSGRAPLRWVKGEREQAVLVEGAKAAASLVSAGIGETHAVYSLGDTGGLRSGDMSAIPERDVVVWADKDKPDPSGNRPGDTAMTRAASRLASGRRTVRRVETDGLPEGTDAADFEGKRIAELLEAGKGYLDTEQYRAQLEDDLDMISEAMSPNGVARQLIKAFPDKLLAVEGLRGRVEMLWDNGGGVWTSHEPNMFEAAAEACKNWRNVNIERILGGTMARDLKSWSRSYETTPGLLTALEGAGTVLVNMTINRNKPDGIIEAKDREIDSDTRYIGAPNGVVNLVDGSLLTGSAARSKLITHSIPDAYDPDARHPAVDQLFAHLPDRERSWLLDSLGFAIHGWPSRRALLIVGPGGGGKSTLLAALAACLGNTGGGYAGDMSEGALASGKQVHAGLNPEMAVFQLPKRLVVVGEESALSNIGRFKRLTGGDNLTVRKPYERESRTLRVSATIVQAVNEDTLPNLRLENEATFDRLRTLPYPSIPESERDPNLGGVLVNHPGARQALFALLIRHAVENRLAPADIPSVAEKRAEVRRESIGAGFYDWATSAVVKTGIAYEMLFTSEAWDSALAYAAQDNDVGENADVVWGMKRYQFIRKLRSFLELPPARQLRRDDFAGRGWQRVRLARPSEIETSTAEASQPELYCTSKLEDGATCGQPIENGRCIAEFDHRDNSDQGPPPAAATGGKQGEFPGTAERGGQRNHLVHALDRRIEYWKSVQREAVAKPDSSALWQCTFVRPVLRSLREAESCHEILTQRHLDALGGADAFLARIEEVSSQLHPDTAKMMDWDTLFWDLRRLVDQTREDVQEQTEVRVLDRLRLLGQKALNAGRGNYP